MTSTTFTAPAVLVWFQVKYLRGLFLALLGGLAAAVVCHPNELYFDLTGAGGMSPLLFFGFLSVAFAVLLFGMEYQTGNSPYIFTRPVSARLLFAEKSLLVILFTLACGFGAEYFLGPSAPPCGLFLTAVYLNVALWCAGACILFRDPVRGILYGGASFVPLAGLLYFSARSFFQDTFEYRPSGPFDFYWYHRHTVPIMTLGVVLSPFLTLGILSTVDAYRRQGEFRRTITSALALAVLIGYFGLVHWTLRVDTSAVYFSDLRYDYPTILTSHHGDGFVVYVEADQRLMGSAQPIRIKRLDLTDPTAVPEVTSQIFATSGTAAKYRSGTHCEAYMTHDRLLLFGRDNISWKLFGLDEEFRATPMKEFDLEGLHQWGSVIDSTTVYVSGLEAEGWKPKLLHLETGEVEDLSERLKPDYSVIPGRPNYSINRNPDQWSITKEDSDGEIHVVAHLLPLASMNFDHCVLVGWSMKEFNLRHKEDNIASPMKMLNVYDLSVPENPITSQVAIPPKLFVQSEGIERFLTRINGNPVTKTFPNSWGYRYHLDGGLLSAWFLYNQRVAVWDVRDSAHPVFLGIASARGDMPPYEENSQSRWGTLNFEHSALRRSDGAIGYLTRHGPMWLEFPALMKEAKKS